MTAKGMSEFINSFWDKLTDPLRKNALFLMAQTGSVAILGFVFWMVATRVYSEGDVGLASATISAISLLAMFGLLGFDIALIRFLPESKEPNKIINTAISITGLFSIFLGMIFILGLQLKFWSPTLTYILDDVRFTIFFLLLVIAATINPLLNSSFLARRTAEYSFLNSLIFSILKIILIASLFSLTFLGILLSWGMAFILAASISIFVLLPRLYTKYIPRLMIKKKFINYMFNYSIGNYVAGIFGSLTGLLLPLIIIETLSLEETAYFSISWMIAYFLFTIPISISISLFAEGSIFEGNYKQNLKKAIRFTALLLSLGVLVVVLGSNIILSIGFGQSYSDNASDVLRLFAISSIPVSINSLYTASKRVEKRTKEIIIIYGFIAFGTIGMSILFLNQFGLIGVPIAWIITQTIPTPITLKGINNVLKDGLKVNNNIK